VSIAPFQIALRNVARATLLSRRRWKGKAPSWSTTNR
jgi:hypothetical protein